MVHFMSTCSVCSSYHSRGWQLYLSYVSQKMYRAGLDSRGCPRDLTERAISGLPGESTSAVRKYPCFHSKAEVKSFPTVYDTPILFNILLPSESFSTDLSNGQRYTNVSPCTHSWRLWAMTRVELIQRDLIQFKRIYQNFTQKIYRNA